ncbi:next to BRCA1 gene 1 protein [Austrofundulus limnaeus]|uniref:Next to BRCA1 gene 1 protein n=1 Tax=Austrofundulus limnaeus TaxID=52670 RepID=A0A2I4C4G4_AUSLI|nr:PREDICTED: next to BRCA1 gene 1 protein-like [Austrofundulus limnaeus]
MATISTFLEVTAELRRFGVGAVCIRAGGAMDLHINIKIHFRGNYRNFLLVGSEMRSWESMEAMVKRSFGLCSLQLTYFDEDNEEISINSQGEYEEALKSATRQGNRLNMNVCEIRGHPARVSSTKVTGAEPKKGFRPTQHCPTLTQAVSRKVQAVVPEQSMFIMKEVKGAKEEDKVPPAWFTSYMEKFKDQVVREAVEKICQEFSGQCCIHKPLAGGGGGGGSREETIGRAESRQNSEVSSSTLPGVPTSFTPSCSSCKGQTSGGGYQCSVCTSCTLCEPCSFSHDPSHNLMRARTPLSIPEHGSPAPDQNRLYRRGDHSFRKAEKQRLKAEKRLLKAEVKEIRKQLRMERRGIQWSSSQTDGGTSPVLLQPQATQHNSPEHPKHPSPLAVPAMKAAFLDENLPDGTRLRPGTKFIKYWKMKNTGTVNWTTDTKLKFMWGNLAVGSGERWREVSVPFLQPGQVGIVSVALCSPAAEGSYTSHWRLSHDGEQFGPRVWCSILVDLLAPAPMLADGIFVSPCVTPQNLAVKEGKVHAALLSEDQEEFYIPSVDLLTAQDLLSFELLDINIVQELECVPNNSPAEVTPCISPPTQDGQLLNKSDPFMGLTQKESEVSHSKLGKVEQSCNQRISEPEVKKTEEEPEEEKEEAAERTKERTRSCSSSSSSEDYIIILPDCFDTSRPLGDSMYSSALSQPGDIPVKASSDSEQPSDSRVSASCGGELGQMDEATAGPIMESSEPKGPGDMLHASQVLAEKIPTPEVVAKAVITASPEIFSGPDVNSPHSAEEENLGTFTILNKVKHMRLRLRTQWMKTPGIPDSCGLIRP